MRTRLLLPLGIAVAAFVAAACGKKIGDECMTNVDCSQEAERTCDLSQPGGYCTVDGCDERSCPEDSVCIRFFPRLFLSKPCDPANINSCTPDEICLAQNGRDLEGNPAPGCDGHPCCAPRASERRYCAATCGSGGDCRGGYSCREAGTVGSLALTRKPNARVRFCAGGLPPSSALDAGQTTDPATDATAPDGTAPDATVPDATAPEADAGEADVGTSPAP